MFVVTVRAVVAAPLRVAPHALNADAGPSSEFASPQRSVGFWPAGANSTRYVLYVPADVDSVRSSLRGIPAAGTCVHSGRSGLRVRNLAIISAARARWLVFEPEEGVGEYELYTGCAPLEGGDAQAEAWWRARATSATLSSLPSALLLRREARTAAVGPQWGESIWGASDPIRRSLGNTRARILVSDEEARAGAVRATIPWRRRAWPPLGTALHLYCHAADATGEGYSEFGYGEVARLEVLAETSERAELLFEPSHGAGEYDLYYMPHTTRWEAYDARDDVQGTTYDVRYASRWSGRDEEWAARWARDAALPRVSAFDIQARTHADRFDSMDRPATAAQLAEHLAERAAAASQQTSAALEAKLEAARRSGVRLHEAAAAFEPAVSAGFGSPPPPPPFLLYPEHRTRPLKLPCQLPERWALSKPATALASHARPNEFFVWQVGLYAAADDVTLLNCSHAPSHASSAAAASPSPYLPRTFPEPSPNGRTLSHAPSHASSAAAAPQLHCFNLGGVGHDGQPLHRTAVVRKGCARGFWFGVQLPDSDEEGETTMRLEIRLHLAVGGSGVGGPPTAQHAHTGLKLTIGGGRLADRGDSRRWRLSRLRWLDSKLGHTATIPAPFTPVVASAPAPAAQARRRGWDGVAESIAAAASGAASLLQGYEPSPACLHLSARMGDATVGCDGLPLQLFAGQRPEAAEAAAAEATVEAQESAARPPTAPHAVLSEPLQFVVRWRRAGSGPGQRAEALRWRTVAAARLGDEGGEGQAGGGQVSRRWRAELAAEGGAPLRLSVAGEWWFDAQLAMALRLHAEEDVTLAASELRLGVAAAVRTHLMGFGRPGRRFEENTPLQWEWAVGAGNYMVWAGGADAGVRLRLVGAAAGFESPQHLLEARDLPDGWYNGGAGGADVGADGMVRAFGGGRELRRGESVEFRFELLLTPVKPLEMAAHWAQRYYQVGYPTPALVSPEEVAATGATVLNLHQGVNGMLNPYINYPFERHAQGRLAAYVGRAHALGLRAKTYYTVRELSDHAQELWVLRSLGDEVLDPGEGGGDSWANEHLGGHRACWQNPLSDGGFDSALCNGKQSRFLNYYLEGLRTLLRSPVGLDGIYYDGISFGSGTMRRVRRVMQAEAAGGRAPLVDLHCGNNLHAKYGDVSPALQFMHLLPYVHGGHSHLGRRALLHVA